MPARQIEVRITNSNYQKLGQESERGHRVAVRLEDSIE